MTMEADASGHRAARPVRIACLVHGVGGVESGVRRLILDQAAAWARYPGVSIGLFVRCEAGTEGAWRDEPNVIAVASSSLGMPGRFVARELLSVRVALWRPDVIYLRHTTISPSLLALASAYPTVVGGDLDDLDELPMMSRLRFWYMRLMRERLLRRARRIMVVTHEIARRRSITAVGQPVDVFPNTIDIDAYPVLAAPDNASPRLVFIGAPGLPWAGLDKVVRLAQRFPEWQFDVIGSDAEELAGAPPNIRAYGQLTRAQYLPVLAQADVAIGPLALHRKSLNETSALKVAEYLACGIPVILATRETAFPNGAPFLLTIPNAEDNVDTSADAIAAFVAGWRGRRVPRESVSGIDVDVVEPQRIELVRREAARERRVANEDRSRILSPAASSETADSARRNS
jgi:glycosyltransferase involved in cell wall biosynthesis